MILKALCNEQLFHSDLFVFVEDKYALYIYTYRSTNAVVTCMHEFEKKKEIIAMFIVQSLCCKTICGCLKWLKL